MKNLNECIHVLDELYDSELAMDARAELAALRADLEAMTEQANAEALYSDGLRAENERLREALGNILRSSVPAFGDDGIPITDDDGNLGMIYDNLYFNAANEALK